MSVELDKNSRSLNSDVISYSTNSWLVLTALWSRPIVASFVIRSTPSANNDTPTSACTNTWRRTNVFCISMISFMGDSWIQMCHSYITSVFSKGEHWLSVSQQCIAEDSQAQPQVSICIYSTLCGRLVFLENLECSHCPAGGATGSWHHSCEANRLWWTHHWEEAWTEHCAPSWGQTNKIYILFKWHPLYVLVWRPDLLCACQTEEVLVFPATHEAQKAFDDLTTVELLQQELQ